MLLGPPPIQGDHSRYRLKQTASAGSGAIWPVSAYSAPSLARQPGLAERPERDPEQGQVLDEELPRDRRQGGEAAETRLPNAGCGEEEAQGREEHHNRQGAADGGSPRREGARGDEQRDGDLDDAKPRRE